MNSIRYIEIHEDYKPRFEAVIDNLVSSFPRVKFSGIELYTKDDLYIKDEDKSLARVEDSLILLNSYWFTKPFDFLYKAIIEGRESTPMNFIYWHGGVGGIEKEPERLITHEFGHLLSSDLDGYEKFSKEGHAKVLQDPSLATGGYSLVDPDEWFAEVFAAWRMGSSGSPQCAELAAFIDQQFKLDSIIDAVRGFE